MRLRFLAPRNHLTVAELRYLTEIDQIDHYGLVAVLADDPRRMAGVGRWVRDADAPRDRPRWPSSSATASSARASAAHWARRSPTAHAPAASRASPRIMLPENTAAQRLFAHISEHLTTRYDGGTYSLVADLTRGLTSPRPPWPPTS